MHHIMIKSVKFLSVIIVCILISSSGSYAGVESIAQALIVISKLSEISKTLQEIKTAENTQRLNYLITQCNQDIDNPRGGSNPESFVGSGFPMMTNELFLYEKRQILKSSRISAAPILIAIIVILSSICIYFVNFRRKLRKI